MFGLNINDFDRLFSDFFSKSKINTNVIETDDEFLVSAELPGVKKEKIRVEYKNDSLNIYIIEDESAKEIPNMKSLSIPNIDYKISKATYTEGLLEIKLPKKEKIDKTFLIPIE